MRAELVGVGVGVKEAVAAVARQRQVLRQRGRVGVDLCCSERGVAVLQRDLRTKHLGVGARLRGPLHEVLYTVAVQSGLVFALRRFADVGVGIARKDGAHAAQKQTEYKHQREETGTEPFAHDFFFIWFSFLHSM